LAISVCTTVRESGSSWSAMLCNKQYVFGMFPIFTVPIVKGYF
jgi:hypothetical protein